MSQQTDPKPRPLSAGLVGLFCVWAGVACEPIRMDVHEPRNPVLITVDVRQTHQTMEGFGVSSRIWDDPHVSNAPSSSVPHEAQEAVLTLLYGDLGLTRVRPILDAGIEIANDNDDPAVFNWDGFNFQWKRNDAHVGLVRQAQSRGMEVFFTSPVKLEKWMTEENPEEYVEWALAILLRWRELGLEMPYFSVINEPGHPFSGLWSPAWMQVVVKRLGARMRAEGLRTRLVIPDDVNPGEAYPRARAVLTDPEARPYVGAVAYHLYGSKEEDLRAVRDLSMQYKIPVWMTEFSVQEDNTYAGAMEWAKIIHKLIALYEVSAVDYMWGFFGSWDQGHTIVNVDFDNGRYLSHRPGPLYYVIGQFSRYVRPGSVRVSAHSSQVPILVTAYRSGGQLVIVAINASHDDRRADVTVEGMVIPASFSAILTNAEQTWREVPVILSTRSGFNAILPANSVMTFCGSPKASTSIGRSARSERDSQ